MQDYLLTRNLADPTIEQYSAFIWRVESVILAILVIILTSKSIRE